ncbi:CHAD domain-containing protein [Antrihabitans spumae]|uniref:CHAD domain-containing protein n=1 Tax=Antrihabitans spumae TaxID=3373370 RepID=A0ABW7KBP0_9NOCA
MVETAREREDKYDVDLEFVLPSFDGVLPHRGAAEDRVVRLRSIYYDTATLALLDRGITLRRREGDVDNGWQLKVPGIDDRTEISVPLTESDTVPAELAELVSGIARGLTLTPVVDMRTQRRVLRTVDDAGTLVVEIADDMVDSTRLGTTKGRSERSWREVEVELGTATEDDASGIGECLIAAGAKPAGRVTKLERALNLAPMRENTHRGKRTAKEIVAEYVAAQADAIFAGDVALRRGLAPIHDTRVATRRLRSILRTFDPLFDGAQAGRLDDELRWYAAMLGEVRDRQVQRSRQLDAVRALPDELVLGPVIARIDNHLAGEEAEHLRVLREEMAGERYLNLLETLALWEHLPEFASDFDDGERKVVRHCAERASRKARKRLRRAVAGKSDAVALHRARKAAKRARYAAEAATPVLGERAAAALIQRHKRVQRILGEHQDTVVSRTLIRRLASIAGTATGENGFTYGLLYEREQFAAQRAERKIVRRLK